jgi:cell wall-active antibiotic response 4TMS protein YvqF
MNEITKRRVDSGALFGGLVLIAVGALFLLDRLDVADFGYVTRRYWPLIVVAFGVSKLLHRHVWAGLWMITIGAWLQAARLRLFGLTFGTSWPLLLIAFGAGLVIRTVIESARRRDSHEA